jgi:hypothetical protein
MPCAGRLIYLQIHHAGAPPMITQDWPSPRRRSPSRYKAGAYFCVDGNENALLRPPRALGLRIPP